jgi:hypothetical protein
MKFTMPTPLTRVYRAQDRFPPAGSLAKSIRLVPAEAARRWAYDTGKDLKMVLPLLSSKKSAREERLVDHRHTLLLGTMIPATLIF